MKTTIDTVLESDHRQLDTLLGEVFSAIDDADFEKTFSTLDLFWARLAMHIRAEHLHLFPAILNSGEEPEGYAAHAMTTDLQEIVRGLHEDHDFFMREIAGAIKSMRAAEPGDIRILSDIRDTLTNLRQRLGEHNQIEEERIYNLEQPLARTSNSLVVAIQKELNNLPPRFSRKHADQ